MARKKVEITPEMHRQLAVDLFNSTWTLIDKEDRSAADDDLMIHSAHASAYHWLQIGEPLNFERSHWQISRVYALLEQPEAALYHAQRCLRICEDEGIGDFDVAFAYEALARAYATGGDSEKASMFAEKGHKAGENIKKKDDRDYFFAELGTIDA